jgi:hypothetical protein
LYAVWKGRWGVDERIGACTLLLSLRRYDP